MQRNLRSFFVLAVLVVAASVSPASRGAVEHHFLYVSEPGIRNYVEYGGVGVIVYDIDAGYKFVRRFPTQQVPPGAEPENVKGIAASAATGRLYVTTIRRLMAFDLATDKKVWDREMPGGADRLAVSPDGKTLYVPTLEGPQWNVVDGITGELREPVVTNSGAHNTIYGPDGKRVYLAGLRSPMLKVADPSTSSVVQEIGPFANVIRPFTINGAQTRVYVNVNDLLGFEVGDLKTGKVLQHVEVKGYEKGEVKRHGCPSHGIALTPDEKELWLADGHNSAVHVFDMTAAMPRSRSRRSRCAISPAGSRSGWTAGTRGRRPARSSTRRRRRSLRGSPTSRGAWCRARRWSRSCSTATRSCAPATSSG